MPIPISYNIRNLRLRKGLTIMTALGIALTVTTAIFLMALLAGLKRAFVTNGEPLNVLVVSSSIHKRFSGAALGDELQFGKGPWKVVGIFDAGGTAYESEIWGDVNQMASDFDRQGGFSSAYLRATDPVAADALKNRVSED